MSSQHHGNPTYTLEINFLKGKKNEPQQVNMKALNYILILTLC